MKLIAIEVNGGVLGEGGGVNSLKICWCDDDVDEGWSDWCWLSQEIIKFSENNYQNKYKSIWKKKQFNSF